MDSFDVIISPKAMSQLNDYIDYLQYTLLNDQAAYNVWQDALVTRDQLSKVAGSLKLCTHPQLKKKGYCTVIIVKYKKFRNSQNPLDNLPALVHNRVIKSKQPAFRAKFQKD